jgi:hypothetical protein
MYEFIREEAIDDLYKLIEDKYRLERLYKDLEDNITRTEEGLFNSFIIECTSTMCCSHQNVPHQSIIINEDDIKNLFNDVILNLEKVNKEIDSYLK